MSDPIATNLAHTGPLGPTSADSAWRMSKPLPRGLTLTAVTGVAFVVCSVHAAFASANTVFASGIGYLCLTLIMFGCALAFWMRARIATGTLRARWSLIAVAALSASIGYVPSFTESVWNTLPQRILQTVCFNASEALYILAILLFFGGVTRSIVLVDALQALLFFVLRFYLSYSPVSRDHFAINHLIVSQCVALVLFVAALAGCMGAASTGERDLLRVFSWFFGLRLIAYFCANQVSYLWLHYTHCSLWDVPGPVLVACFSLYLLYTQPAARLAAARDEQRASSVTVRSLMPSFMAVVNLILGLFLLRVSVTMAAAAMSASLICYVARTALLQAQVMGEKSRLESRNEQLEGLAVRDPLTGIGNRRSLAAAYSHLQAADGAQSLSLLLTDIDQFKQENDCHGHLHGDKVLIALARKLESFAARVADSHCVRLGGDEFALLLPRASAQTACALAEELRASFRMNSLEIVNSAVSLSIGVASVDAARQLPLETLVSWADEALYRAKKLGRNRVEMQPAWKPEPATAGQDSESAVALEHAAL